MSGKRKARAVNDIDWLQLACGLILVMAVTVPWVILISRVV